MRSATHEMRDATQVMKSATHKMGVATYEMKSATHEKRDASQKIVAQHTRLKVPHKRQKCHMQEIRSATHEMRDATQNMESATQEMRSDTQRCDMPHKRSAAQRCGWQEVPAQGVPLRAPISHSVSEDELQSAGLVLLQLSGAPSGQAWHIHAHLVRQAMGGVFPDPKPGIWSLSAA
ncbi:hypothetical protein NDU88_000044 [Pleurodeles waltl]|uniref:Uncharacterized protein n=1 Tax=Pleurodeles waltl TaxID=8319 RepID=A0AAV7L6W5_PLEWA|nr:hypothetical protein NDU88_000044 [Pleurodeles waltl]